MERSTDLVGPKPLVRKLLPKVIFTLVAAALSLGWFAEVSAAPCRLPGDALDLNTLPPLPAKACPINGTPMIRPPDGCASEGGDFLSARAGGYHRAYDLNAAAGTDVRAAQDGCVALVHQDWGKMGKTVVIRHEAGFYSVYGHLQSTNTVQGRAIKAGEIIGKVGSTGNSDCLADKKLKPHLHFAVIVDHRSDLFMAGKPLTRNSEWERFFDDAFYGDFIANGVQRPDALLSGMNCWTRNDGPIPQPPNSVSVQ